MILGIIILKKRYSLREYISIVLISAGIFICTMASSNDIKSTKPSPANSVDNESNDAAAVSELVEYVRWLTGILMLTIALLLSASMGIIQETLYKQYGKYPSEALYYNVIQATHFIKLLIMFSNL